MTAYQMLHRAAQAKSGESVPVHDAADRVSTATLEVAALAQRCGMNFIFMNFVFYVW